MPHVCLESRVHLVFRTSCWLLPRLALLSSEMFDGFVPEESVGYMPFDTIGERHFNELTSFLSSAAHFGRTEMVPRACVERQGSHEAS